jgi:hypothetical protein
MKDQHRIGRSEWSVYLRSWWKAVVAGAVLILLVIVGSAVGVDAWFLGFLAVILAFGLMAVGLAMGVSPSRLAPPVRCSRVKGVPLVLLAATALSLTACTGLQGGEPHDDGSAKSTAASDDEFCEAMSHLIALLAPTDSSSPSETQKTFEEAAVWF